MYKFMRLRKDQDIVRSSGIAALLLIAGLIITQVTHYIEFGFVFIVMALILFIIVIQAATSSKEGLIKDGMTKQVNEKAGYYAFIVLCFSIWTICLIDMYLPLNLKLKDVTPSFWIIAVWGWIISRWYLNKKKQAH
jgi:uncharacterized membrane protein